MGKAVKLLLLFFTLFGLGGGITIAGFIRGEQLTIFNGLLLLMVSLIPFFLSAIYD